jgi:hypothetical protein
MSHDYYARHTGVFIVRVQAIAAVRQWMAKNTPTPRRKEAPKHNFYSQRVEFLQGAEGATIDGLTPEDFAIKAITKDALLEIVVERCHSVLERCPFLLLWKYYKNP